jgi:hypothetical protein
MRNNYGFKCSSFISMCHYFQRNFHHIDAFVPSWYDFNNYVAVEIGQPITVTARSKA